MGWFSTHRNWYPWQVFIYIIFLEKQHQAMLTYTERKPFWRYGCGSGRQFYHTITAIFLAYIQVFAERPVYSFCLIFTFSRLDRSFLKVIQKFKPQIQLYFTTMRNRWKIGHFSQCRFYYSRYCIWWQTPCRLPGGRGLRLGKTTPGSSSLNSLSFMVYRGDFSGGVTGKIWGGLVQTYHRKRYRCRQLWRKQMRQVSCRGWTVCYHQLGHVYNSWQYKGWRRLLEPAVWRNSYSVKLSLELGY